MADLTGGLGVDSWAFAQRFGEVLYNEMNPVLAKVAEGNFKELGISNIRVQSKELKKGNVQEVLGGFAPDIIFLDPARRGVDGRKVFRIEDCHPDVLSLKEELLEACPRLLLKLSPMADISLVCRQLGSVSQVHVVEAEGECKELLLLLERGYVGPYSLTLFASGAVAEIVRDDAPAGAYATTLEGWLFEPGKGLLKAGAFDWPCTQFGLRKLGRHTHLYISETPVPEELRPFGKVFRILESAPLDKRSIKAFGERYPKAEVTARNIPLSSDALRTKLGVRSGGDVHLFGAKADALQENRLIACQDHD